MSCPVQVENTGASYKIVGNNFEYCPLCRTITSVYRKTAFTEMLVNCGTVQVQDTMEKLLERSLRINAELKNILSSATELCHAQITISNVQQAVEESGPSEPSALAFGSVCVARNQMQGRTEEDIFGPSI